MSSHLVCNEGKCSASIIRVESDRVITESPTPKVLIAGDNAPRITPSSGAETVVAQPDEKIIVQDDSPTPVVAAGFTGPKGDKGDPGTGAGGVQVNVTIAASSTASVDVLDLDEFEAAKWLIAAINPTSGDRQYIQVDAIHNGTDDADHNEYSVIPDEVVDFDIDVVVDATPSMVLQITNNETVAVTFKVLRLAIQVTVS